MKWEYKTLTIDHFLSSDSSLTIEDQLNNYGKDGWEFVGILEKPYTTLGNTKLDSNSMIFKKSITE
ncbi:MAG: DUF4177 domain-containing protein [Clostridiaceae bacterium]